MTNSSPQATKDHYTSDAAISPWRIGLLATACGLLAANVYYSQPIAVSTAVALLGSALSMSPLPYLASALLVGLGSVAVQILVPYAAQTAPEAIRGRVV